MYTENRGNISSICGVECWEGDVNNIRALKDRRRELRRSQTEAEGLFWSRVRNRRFFGLKFYRQFSVGPYILDFFCHSLRLNIELDGHQHGGELEQRQDAERDAYLQRLNITVVRYTNLDVHQHLDTVLQDVANTIAQLTQRT